MSPNETAGVIFAVSFILMGLWAFYLAVRLDRVTRELANLDREYFELLAKPLSFWQERDRNIRMFEASMRATKELAAFSNLPQRIEPPTDDKVVTFRKPSSDRVGY